MKELNSGMLLQHCVGVGIGAEGVANSCGGPSL